MNKVTIRLYLGCGLLRHSVNIELNAFYVEEFYESRLLVSGVTPTEISGLLVGPRTVVELYSDSNLYERTGIIINKSHHNNKFHDLGCVLNENWQGYLRSFRIWNYDYYIKVHSIRYCNSDIECNNDEYCLCPNGYQQPAWCPIQKRRCMHKSKYLQSNLPKVGKYDIIDTDCVNYRLNRRYTSFNEIEKASSNCDLDMREFFDGDVAIETRNNNLFYIIILVIILIYMYIKCTK